MLAKSIKWCGLIAALSFDVNSVFEYGLSFVRIICIEAFQTIFTFEEQK